MKVVSLVVTGAVIGFFSNVSSGFAGSYECSVWGEQDGMPSIAHPKGTYCEEFKGVGATQDEASQSALKLCAQTPDRCDETASCRELILLDPRPLASNSEVSCADDTGLQVVITRYSSTPDRLATVYKNNVQVISYIVKAEFFANQSKPFDYESAEGDFNLAPTGKLVINEGSFPADNPVRCIWPEPSPYPGGNMFPGVHGH